MKIGEGLYINIKHCLLILYQTKYKSFATFLCLILTSRIAYDQLLVRRNKPPLERTRAYR
jgi:hypothetical protein